MKLLLLAALCAIALAKIPSPKWEEDFVPEYESREKAFIPGREFHYFYNGQLATGIPGSSKQHSVTRIQALVSFVFKSSESVMMKFKEVRFGKLNDRVESPHAMVPFMAFEEVPIESELKERLLVPLKFSYSRGMISDIVFEGIEEAWSANIKRGVLNMLQVNLFQHKATDLTEEALVNNRIVKTETPEQDFFRVMEDTVEGECETLYTVTRQPHPYYTAGPVLNVTKSINFERCNRRPEVKYNFRFADPCPSCETGYNEKQKFLKSSTVAKYNITGTRESFLIESVRFESQYTFVPFNEEANVINTYVNQTLVLVKSGPIQMNIPELSSPKPSDSQLIFTPDWDILKEKFFMEGETSFLDKTPYSEVKDKLVFVANVLRQLISHIHENVEEEAPRQFNRLVKVFRMLKREEIERIHEKFYTNVPEQFTPEEHKKIRSMLVDAIAFAGTKDCISHLVQKIKNREIDPLTATLAIKSLINVRVVSKEMIEELWTLAEHEVVERHYLLKQSVYLTIGSLVNALCTPNEDTLAMEFKVRPEALCPRVYKEELNQKFFEKFRSARNWEEKIMYLKAITNAGLDLSVFELERIIKNVETQYPVIVRTEAILALRQIKDFMPRKVQKILMPLFMNKLEHPEIRIAAVYQVLQTLPERPILDQISMKLFNERNLQVASFVYSYMFTMANSTQPCEKKFSDDLKLALRHGKAVNAAFMPGYSKFLHMPIQAPKYKLGMGIDFTSIWQNTSFIPSRLTLSLHKSFLGFWSKHMLSFGFASEGLEQLLWKYFGERGFFYEKSMEEILSRSARSLRTANPINELKNIWQKLSINERAFPTSTPKGLFYMRFKDQEFGFLPFSMETLSESVTKMFEEGTFRVGDIERFLEAGHHFKLYKAFILHEIEHKIPTTLGLPLVWSVSIPTVLSLTGRVKAEIEPNNMLKRVKVDLEDFKPSFVSIVDARVETWSPIVNTGLKIKAIAKVFVPLDVSFELNLEQSTPFVRLSVKPPRRPVEWVRVETRPITYTVVWPKSLKTWAEPEEKTILGEEWNRVYTFDQHLPEFFPVLGRWFNLFTEYSESVVGVKPTIRGFWHHTPKSSVAGTPFCPLSGPNKFVFMTEPGYEMPEEFVFKFTGKAFERFEQKMKPSFRDFEPIEDETEEEWKPEYKRFTEFENEEPSHSNNFKVEIYTKGSKFDRKMILDTTFKCGESLRFCKFESQILLDPLPRLTSEPMKLCMEGETLFPEAPSKYSELSGKKAISQFKWTWGRSCNAEHFVTLKIQAERSREQIENDRQDPYFKTMSEDEECKDKSLCSPVSIYEPLYNSAEFLQYKVDIDYKNLPVLMMNTTNFFFRLLKSHFFWNVDVANFQVRNPEDKIRAVFKLDAKTRQYFNLTIKTPRENTTFKDIPLPVRIAPVNMRRSSPIRSFSDVFDMYSSPMPVCHISSSRVKTFDNVEYSVPLTTCWTVLAKDCSNDDEPRFAVLARKLNQESEKKEVKIITRSHRFVLTPETEEYDSVKIEFNGRKFTPEEFETIFDHEHVVVRCEKMGSTVKCELPETGIKVFFDGYAVNIKMSPMYRNVQCGLCGHYDLETEGEFRTSKFEQTDDVREFYKSYLLNEDSCSYPKETREICDTPSCDYTPFWETEKMDDKYESREELETSEEPRLRTKVIEQGHQICFSKVGLPKCAHLTFPVSYKPEKKVVYSCLSRTEPMAEVYHRRAERSEVLEEIKDLPASFTETELVPESCRRF
jgi:hypothetical protein